MLGLSQAEEENWSWSLCFLSSQQPILARGALEKTNPLCLLEPEQSQRAALSPQVSGPALVSPIPQPLCPCRGGNIDRNGQGNIDR